jgi:NHS family xanthosine MFS transporter
LPSDASAKNPNKMANLDLGWEKTKQWNVGLDFGFINNRISGSVDYYHNKTTDLILATTIPSLTGYTSTFANGFGAFFGSYAAGAVVDAWGWPDSWYIFAGYALVVAVVFAVVFKYKHNPEEMVSVNH